MSTLFVVATPIGNLSDRTIRAVEVLRQVRVVVAEDTRITRRLLDTIGSDAKLFAYHRRSKPRDLPRILNHLDKGDVAIVSDAGTPGINDPGQEIVVAAVERGHDVTPIPGPSSIIAALSVSGFYADQFTSYGFLPAHEGKRRAMLSEIAASPLTGVFFETPHRLRSALADMATAFGTRTIVVGREITKLHEEIWRGTVAEAIDHFASPRGEFVIVVAPLDRARGGTKAMSRRALQRGDIGSCRGDG